MRWRLSWFVSSFYAKRRVVFAPHLLKISRARQIAIS